MIDNDLTLKAAALQLGLSQGLNLMASSIQDREN
jgi:hypothetical protein